MGGVRRRVTVLLATATVAAGCAQLVATEDAPSGLPAAAVAAPAAPRTPPAAALEVPSLADNEDAVAAVLDEVAGAFLAGDPEALQPWLADPGSRFGQRWLRRAASMREVPLSSYTLRLDTSGADLTTAELPGDGALLVNVLEEHQLQGMEELGPVREHLFLTLRPAPDGGWAVAGDTAAEPLGLVSADHLWDHGPVVATRRGDLLALHHPDQPAVDTLLDEAAAALATADDRWPQPWPRKVPLLIPADQEELAELLHVTFDLDNFIAFATTTPISELGEVEMSGSRVLLNTARFLERSSETRERILVHELVHAASRPSSAPAVPSWLEEGVAQALGERRSTTGTSLLAALADSDWDGSLPLDAEFSAGDRDSIFLSYQRAWSFVDWLVEEHGEQAVGQFYATVGQGSTGEPGTAAAQADAAATEVLGQPLGALVEAWRAQL